MTSACSASVDLGALATNLAQIRKTAPGARVMAVIKANAYGHGLIEVARALEAADAFAVARLEEGVRLRRAGLGGRIVLLEGVQEPDELQQAGALHLDVVVHCPEQLEQLEAYVGTHRFEVWLKLDTGMNRLGVLPQDFGEFWRRLEACAAVASGVRVMTHLANADDLVDRTTATQLELFAQVLEGLRCERSAANSGAVLGWRDSHLDWVRPGILLYGVSPFPDRVGADLGYVPAMRLEARLIAIRDVGVGARVGYGGIWQATAPTRIGVVSIGYGDGYPRHLGNGTPVMLHGRPAQLVGRVSMDMITLSLTDHPQAQVGDQVELWGSEMPVERIARRAGTIPYELLCGITQRVPVSYIT